MIYSAWRGVFLTSQVNPPNDIGCPVFETGSHLMKEDVSQALREMAETIHNSPVRNMADTTADSNRILH